MGGRLIYNFRSGGHGVLHQHERLSQKFIHYFSHTPLIPPGIRCYYPQEHSSLILCLYIPPFCARLLPTDVPFLSPVAFCRWDGVELKPKGRRFYLSSTKKTTTTSSGGQAPSNSTGGVHWFCGKVDWTRDPDRKTDPQTKRTTRNIGGLD